tara:strand:- start:9626 stop:10375 length:750 start_codon:yes stop_codon:yes gene_type:complete
MKKIAVSGGFDPIHIGHLRLFQHAAKLGDELIVILNSQNFLNEKKGYYFMPYEERKEIIEGFGCVTKVVDSIDDDNTVCKTLEDLALNYGLSIFANGGDRNDDKEIPEAEVCYKNNIELVFGVGGGKIQSSSSMYEKIGLIKKPWGYYKTYEKKDGYLLKKIVVYPGELLSLQSHNHRAEKWIVASGIATVEVDKKIKVLGKSETVSIKKNQQHRLSNLDSEELVLIELQFGEILSEDDIIRYEDKYDR